jgi:hypothetical protein
MAQVEAASGDYDKAQAQAQVAAEGLRGLGAQGEPNLALALEFLGDTLAHHGDLAGAATTLKQAVSIRERSTDDLWELARSRERLGEVMLKSADSSAPALLRNAARDLESQLGADHSETLRAKNALSRAL